MAGISNVVRKTSEASVPSKSTSKAKTNTKNVTRVFSAANDNSPYAGDTSKNEVSNVARLHYADNDNDEYTPAPGTRDISKVQRETRPSKPISKAKAIKQKISAFRKAQNDNRLSVAKLKQVKSLADDVVDVANAGSAAWFIVGVTWELYLVQLIGAGIAINGIIALYAIENTALGYINFFGLASSFTSNFLYAGIAVTLAMGILTLILSIAILALRRVNMMRSYSLLIMALCLPMYVAPGFNLVPWYWLWLLYVVKSQVDKK